MVRRTAIEGDPRRWSGLVQIDKFREDHVNSGKYGRQEPKLNVFWTMMVFEDMGK